MATLFIFVGPTNMYYFSFERFVSFSFLFWVHHLPSGFMSIYFYIFKKEMETKRDLNFLYILQFYIMESFKFHLNLLYCCICSFDWRTMRFFSE